ncbi:nitroreductase family protein, partial [candidate division KSB1 bacterium]|nr:nitroreductase family protein [candidate division KSB1 bacterium]
VLLYVLCRRIWPKSGRVNEWAKFDAGAAWMSLALQARKLGLYAHAMAGFNREEAYKVLRVPEEEYEIIAAIAVGYYGDTAQLPEDLQKREKPSDRKSPDEVFKLGRFE